MKLHEAYREVKNRLDRLDFSSLWDGFCQLKFALYNDTECCFDGEYIEKTADFIANTSIQYNGEYIAIWNLSEGAADLDRLAASIVHEMFHAFQHIRGESRWPDEMAALFDYRYSAENISLKLREAALMEDILINDRASSFPELLALRRMRANLYPKEYDYEARIEQIEGSAKYIELKALAQMNAEKGALRWRKILAGINDPCAYTPIRVISYDVGAAFLDCINQYSSFNYSDFSPSTFAQEIIENAVPAEQGYPLNPAVEKSIKAFFDGTRGIIEAALSKNDVVLRGEYPLCSLNIWDVRWDGKYAISNFFVSYFDNGEIKNLDGNYVVEMGRDCIIHTVYRQ